MQEDVVQEERVTCEFCTPSTFSVIVPEIATVLLF
jgi:hypothetical protein